MPDLFNGEEFKQQKRRMMKIFKEHNVPHIQVRIENEEYDVDPANSPITEIAQLYEALVNTLIGDIVLGGNEEAAVLLDHVKRDLETQLLLMGNLSIISLEKRIAKGKEGLGKQEEETELPVIFKEALDQIQKKEEGQ